MDGDGDPHYGRHPQTPAPSDPRYPQLEEEGNPRCHEAQTEMAAVRKAKKLARRMRRQKVVALELEQGKLQKEDLPQITLGSSAALAMGSHGYPETPPDTQHSGEQAPDHPYCIMEPERELRREALVEAAHRIPSSAYTDVPTGTATRVRQSALYSGRLSRSRGSQERKLSMNKLLVEENAGKVSGSVDLPEFKTLALNDTRPKPELTDRVEENAGKVSGIEGPAVKVLPVEVDAGEVSSMEFKASTLRRSPPTLNSTHRSKECTYDTAESKTGSEIVEEKLTDESDPWAQECRDILKYLDEHTYTDLVEGMIAANHGFSNPAQHKLDAQAFWSSRKAFKVPEVSKSFASPTENSVQGEPSTKEIIENAKKWMGEEVMLAFEKYIEGKDQFKDVVYGLDELQHQCFSVESYDHICHHFNFTVKMKKSDSDWSSTPYFAQVKEIYGRKYYSCYKLSSYDDGHCYACINQGMHALKHPICGIGYDSGQAATGSPFIYLSDEE